jgi:hypothetical protein
VNDHNGNLLFVGILLGLSIAFVCQKVPKPKVREPVAVADTLRVEPLQACADSARAE